MQSHPSFQEGTTYYNGGTIDTADYTGSIQCEGVICEWLTDPDPTTPTTRRTPNIRKSIQVRNVSGVVLLPGLMVQWQPGFAGRRVIGYTHGLAQAVAGVVDPRLPAAGVPNGDIFHCFFSGPNLLKQDVANLGADLAMDEWVYAQSAAASTHSTTAGRFIRHIGTFTAAQTTDGTAFNIAANRVGRAMSTSLTSSIGASRLIWMTVPLA